MVTTIIKSASTRKTNQAQLDRTNRGKATVVQVKQMGSVASIGKQSPQQPNLGHVAAIVTPVANNTNIIPPARQNTNVVSQSASYDGFFSLSGQKRALNRVAAVPEVLARKLFGLPLQNQNYNFQDRATNFLVSPGFVALAPAAAAAGVLYGPSLAAGAAAGASSVTNVIGKITPKPGLLGSLGIGILGAGLLSTLFGGGASTASNAPQDTNQNQTGSQTTNTTTTNNQNQTSYNINRSRNYTTIEGSPGASIGEIGGLSSTPSQNSAQTPYVAPEFSQGASANPSQSANAGSTNWLLIAAIVAAGLVASR